MLTTHEDPVFPHVVAPQYIRSVCVWEGRVSCQYSDTPSSSGLMFFLSEIDQL